MKCTPCLETSNVFQQSLITKQVDMEVFAKPVQETNLCLQWFSEKSSLVHRCTVYEAKIVVQAYCNLPKQVE